MTAQMLELADELHEAGPEELMDTDLLERIEAALRSSAGIAGSTSASTDPDAAAKRLATLFGWEFGVLPDEVKQHHRKLAIEISDLVLAANVTVNDPTARPAPPAAASVREALDNSQSLLAMILLLGTTEAPSHIGALHWREEELTKLLEDQMKANRTALSDPAPAVLTREEIATPQEVDDMHSALAELHDDLGRAREMIADVPGDNLHEALSNYIGSYMALQVEVQELRSRCQAETVESSVAHTEKIARELCRQDIPWNWQGRDRDAWVEIEWKSYLKKAGALVAALALTQPQAETVERSGE